MPTHTLVLERFEFPGDLETSRANFRVVFDVKYWSRKNKDTVEVKLATAVKPGADVFWECDPGRRSRPNYRRAMDGDEPLPRIDVDELDPWDREIIHLTSEGIISVRAKVYDVDREDFFDDVRDVVDGLLSGIFGTGERALGEAVSVARGAAGDAADEIRSYLVKKMTGGSDKVLFQGSGTPDRRGRIVITRAGTDGKRGSGDYTIVLRSEEWSPPGEG